MKRFFVFAKNLVIGRVFLKLRHRIALIIDRGDYEVACLQEAHAHYGDKFTQTDAFLYFIYGALSEIFNEI